MSIVNLDKDVTSITHNNPVILSGNSKSNVKTITDLGAKVRRSFYNTRIFGKKWYYRLKQGKSDALLDHISIDELKKTIVVCYTPDSDTHLYTSFDSYVTLYHYINSFEPNKRYFHEVILGDQIQKPHFDVDIDVDDSDRIYSILMDDLLTSLINAFKMMNVDLDLTKDILMYTSHSTINNKRSVHLIIDHYSHMNNHEAAHLYDHVIVNNRYKDMIDPIYTSKHNLRMFGCVKNEDPEYRRVALDTRYKYNGNEYVYAIPDLPDDLSRRLHAFKTSLITYTDGCMPLPDIFGTTPIKRTFSDINITDKIQRIAIDLFTNQIVEHSSFDIDGTRGNMIILKRREPSSCSICHRPHDKDNAYLVISNASIRYGCHRSRGKTMTLILPDQDNTDYHSEQVDDKPIFGFYHPSFDIQIQSNCDNQTSLDISSRLQRERDKLEQRSNILLEKMELRNQQDEEIKHLVQSQINQPIVDLSIDHQIIQSQDNHPMIELPIYHSKMRLPKGNVLLKLNKDNNRLNEKTTIQPTEQVNDDITSNHLDDDQPEQVTSSTERS